MPGDFVFPKDKGPLMYYQNEKVKLVNWLMRLNDFNEDFGWNPDTQWRVPQAPGFSAIPCPEEMISKVYISLGFVWLYYCIALHGEWGATKFWHASKPPPYDERTSYYLPSQNSTCSIERTFEQDKNRSHVKISTMLLPKWIVCLFLFECQNLKDLRQLYLPPEPDLGSTLYSSREQLESTTTYFILANRRRANAHMTAGSVK